MSNTKKKNPDVIVSFRIDKEMHQKMQQLEEVNWSAVLRNLLLNKVKEYEKVV